MSRDCSTALQPGQQEQNYILKKKKKEALSTTENDGWFANQPQILPGPTGKQQLWLLHFGAVRFKEIEELSCRPQTRVHFSHLRRGMTTYTSTQPSLLTITVTEPYRRIKSSQH